jgi:hypothetical protein
MMSEKSAFSTPVKSSGKNSPNAYSSPVFGTTVFTPSTKLVEEGRQAAQGRSNEGSNWKRTPIGKGRWAIVERTLSHEDCKVPKTVDKLPISLAYENKSSKLMCGMCNMYFDKESMEYRVPKHRIIEYQKLWEFEGVQGRRYEAASFLYSTVRVCTMCSQFFEETDQAGGSALMNPTTPSSRSRITTASTTGGGGGGTGTPGTLRGGTGGGNNFPPSRPFSPTTTASASASASASATANTSTRFPSSPAAGHINNLSTTLFTPGKLHKSGRRAVPASPSLLSPLTGGSAVFASSSRGSPPTFPGSPSAYSTRYSDDL